MGLFNSPELRELSDAVTLRATEGTISLRKDRVLHADVGLSAALIDLVRESVLLVYSIYSTGLGMSQFLGYRV